MISRDNEIQKASIVSIISNAVFSALKIGAGLLGRSASMLADGIHSLADMVGDTVVLVFLLLSKRSGKSFRNSGYEKAAAMLVSLILLVIAAELMAHGIQSIRLILDGAEIARPGVIAIAAGVVCIVFKLALYRYMNAIADSTDSGVVKANAWHSLSDAITTIAAIAAVAIARCFGNFWAILDPLTACAISIVIIVIAVKTALKYYGETAKD